MLTEPVDTDGLKRLGNIVTPRRDDVGVVESQSIQFSELARTVARRARALGLTVPVFRSPPRIVGVTRTIRRRRDGHAVVAVAFRNRPTAAVVADLIEGTVVVNALQGPPAARTRDDLWEPFAKSILVAA